MENILMNILQISQSFCPCLESGGVVRVVYEISKELDAKGHNVTVYTTDRCTNRLQVENNVVVPFDGIKVYYFRNLSNKLSKHNIATPYQLFRKIKNDIKNFDIIHIHEHRTLLAVIVHFYAKKNNVPYIIQAHGSVLPFFQKTRLKRLFDKLWGNNILKDSSKVIAGTEAEFDQYIQMGVKKEQIEIIPNAINFQIYKKLPLRGSFRKKFGLNETDKIILYLGRINRIKGLDLLLKSFKLLKNDSNQFKLVFIGQDDGYLRYLEKEIDESIENNIIFIGVVNENVKLEAYVDADVYVLPSLFDNFPITVLEALAAGTPVIVTEYCLIGDIVKKAGRVVDYNEKSLNEAILEILSNNDLKMKLGKNGRKLIRDNYSLEKVGEKIENLYYDIKIRGK